MKKYELTEETIKVKGKTLYRIKALKDFSDVEIGDLGGYVESENNLSQEYNCWIYDNSKVFSTALVFDNAKIYGNAEVFGQAQIYGDALVSDNTEVYGYAQVFDNAEVYGRVYICGEAEVFNKDWIYNHAKIFGNAKIYNQLDLKKYLTKQRLVKAINYL